MLLVTFHGGSGATNNVYGYSTKNGKLETKAALSPPSGVSLDEIRALAVYQGNLYVANGAASNSAVLAYAGPPKSGPLFEYLGLMIGAGQSVMHPFGIAFDPSSPACYVSNQDSNVVAKLDLTIGKKGAATGTLGSGCQSPFLTGLYPPPDAFLDGTFAASQIGELAHVNVANIPNVSAANGGLGVTGSGAPLKPSNSVRDVAIANDILFVCDEVDSQINMYNLSSTVNDVPVGAFLGSGSAHGHKPTHMTIYQDGLWVSADDKLYWSALPALISGASLSFSKVAISVPANNKVGGISFDDSGNVYIVFQEGTSQKGTGSIWKYAVKSGSPPALSHGASFATCTNDTPEFCLWVSDSNWRASKIESDKKKKH